MKEKFQDLKFAILVNKVSIPAWQISCVSSTRRDTKHV